MSRSFCWAALVVLLNVVAARAQSAPGDGVDRNASSAQFEWTELAALPDDQRFGGGFLGVSDGALIFAGGTNFPDALPRQAGTQVWYDSIFAHTANVTPPAAANVSPLPPPTSRKLSLVAPPFGSAAPPPPSASGPRNTALPSSTRFLRSLNNNIDAKFC